jgi:hypothetical protein
MMRATLITEDRHQIAFQRSLASTTAVCDADESFSARQFGPSCCRPEFAGNVYTLAERLRKSARAAQLTPG